MENKKYRLPEREWFSLEGAIKEIKKRTGEEIEIEDLIHFWNIGKLEISINVTINYGFLSVGNCCFSFDDVEHFTIYDSNKIIGERSVKALNFLYITNESMSNLGLEFNLNNKLKSFIENNDFCCMSGLFSLVHYTGFHSSTNETLKEDFGAIVNLNKKISEYTCNNSKVINQDAELYINIILSEGNIFNIKSKDLVITKVHLEQFLTGETNIDIQKEWDKFILQPKISNTVKENQINFIKTLLFMDYGITTEEEARRELRSGRLGTRLEKCKRENIDTFESKNLIIPSDKTLLNWYKNS